ncbi:MAG: hypothetical protein M3N16_00345 [Actinomycetota bacterium]|nr:hypothetical protein [Actinomycetota bacterium]
MTFRLASLLATLALLATSPAAAASLDDPVNQWLPSSDGATWTYEWFDSSYAPQRTREKVTLKKRDGVSLVLDWTTRDQGNGAGTVDSVGSVDYRRTNAGLVNANWQSNPPPPRFPILCANPSRCGNSLASTHYLLIWGTRSPVLAEPVLRDTRWSSVGGAEDDVSSASEYLGTETISVPAFPAGVVAARVRSDITQAGAIGDPYGSGIRTVWWVYGVGPVKIVFEHAGGSDAPVTQAELMSTNLVPKPPPADANHFPLNRGDEMTFRWRNSKHLRRASKQRFTVAEVVNGSARIDVKSLAGPIKVAGGYVFSTRLDGVTNISAFTKAVSRAKLPPLGPPSLPRRKRRRFFTPFDLLAFGFNPILPAYPAAGQSWASRTGSRDFSVFGVTGTSRVLGLRRVRTPAGTFRALAIESMLTQPGFRFGSGTRTSYFAPGKGLVKLVFRHRDRSTSTVERLR